MGGMRRGLTFLETMLASALLAIVAGLVLSTISFISNAQIRDRHRAACAELGNRLMLIYMDDDEELRRMANVIDYAGARYRWSIEEMPVRVELAREDRESRRNSNIDRFNNVRVFVWLSEESGGGDRPGPGVPSADIVRLVDPIPLRNPDTLTNLAMNRRLLDRIGTPGGQRTTPRSFGNSGTTPGPEDER